MNTDKDNVKVNSREREISQMVYAATRALGKAEKVHRREGFFRRLFRWIHESRKLHQYMKGKYYFTAERRRAARRGVFRDCCEPVYEFWEDFADNAWDFICRLASDFKEICLWIADGIIIVAYYLVSIFNFLADLFWDFCFWAEERKSALFKAFVFLVFLVSGSVVLVTSITAYEYSYYGKTLGYTRSKDAVYRTIDILGDKLAEASGANISIDVERDMEFRKIRGFNIAVDSDEDILNTITYMKDLQVDAYAILVDDEVKVILEDEATANAVLQALKAQMAPESDGVEYLDVHFKEAVGVVPKNVSLGEIWNKAQAQKYLMTGSVLDAKTYTVGRGESFDEIAAAQGITSAQLQAANPDVDPESLSEGQTLELSLKEPVISVITKEVATYTENIDYGIQYIDNASLYKDETEVKSPGVYGKNKIVATVDRVNGKEITRVVESKEKISNPIDEVQYRGTKPIPAKIGTGTFKYPLRTYIISSHIGMRWGRMHEGVDFAVSTGTKVYACDGGKVIYSGWINGLGYCVKIDHGGLMTTVYGHCSKLLVSEGDMVYQGQNIALSGNTGNSTGPHLHLELRYNGKVLNPLDYLEK